MIMKNNNNNKPTNKIMRAYNKVAGCYPEEFKAQINNENYDNWYHFAGVVLSEKGNQFLSWKNKQIIEEQFTNFDKKLNG
jgi:hypothetical protein